MINICFHGIGTPGRDLEPDEAGYWIGEDLYRRILDEVHDRSDVALSFDDGNASDIEIGLPRLLDAGRVASFFVLAGRLDRKGSLRADDVRELRHHGMGVGSHGMDHVPWRRLSEPRQHVELDQARSLIAGVIGEPVLEAALPLGRYDRQVLRELRRRGYTRVFSSDRRRARTSSWLQPRYSVHAGDTITSVRSSILAPPPPAQAATAQVKGLVKRLR